MKSFTTSPCPIVTFGEGASLKIGEYLCGKNVKSVLAIFDKTLFSAGIISPITSAIENAGIKVFTYDGILPESPDYIVKELAEIARETSADALVAIGGGSTIDTTRAAMSLRFADGKIEDYFTGERRLMQPTDDNGLFICIPTTAGTGAEMSMGGPILDTKNNVKGGLIVPPKYADYVILDPTLTLNLPPFLTYTTAMDALCHSIEGMTGKLSSHRSDMLCGQAVEYIWRSLPRVMENGKDIDARGELLIAANLAIRAETLRHIGHASSQPVGGKLHLAHGYTCALVLPSTVRFIADVPEVRRELELIAVKMGMDPTKADIGYVIADVITDMNRKYGVLPLKEKDFALEDVLDCIPVIMQDKRLLPNAPREVTEKDVEIILKDMYEF